MSKFYISSMKWIENLFGSKKETRGANQWNSEPTAAISAMEAARPQKEKLKGANPWSSEPKAAIAALEAYRVSKKSLEK